MEKVKILAIDDSADNLFVLKTILTEAFPGALFIPALSAENGIELSLSENPDVILLELDMSEKNGSEVCQILKANEATKNIPVVMVTGVRTDKESRRKALELGADAFLAKPVDESELTAQIRAMLRIKESEDRKLDEKERLENLVVERTRQLEIELTERKRAEEALRESEQLFRGLFNASPDAILLIDPFHPTISWPIVDCNEAACRMNGYTRDAMIGQSIDLLNLKVGSPEERDSYLETLRQKDVFQKESFHRHKDGHVFPVEISTTIVTIRGREMILGIDRDVTERKLAEEELQKSYKMLNNLTAQVPGVVYQYRLYPDGRSAFPYSSLGMYDIYEVTPEEVREDASPVFTRIHPDDVDHIVESINESARNLTLYHSEFRVILPKQGLRWRQCDAKPECWEDGSTLWYGIVTDITERKQTEEALREREELFQGLFNASPDAIVLIDPNHPDVTWQIVDCNKAACQMNGYTREELIGQPIDILNATVGLEEERIAYAKNLRQKSIIHMETTHLHKDGHIFPVEISSSIITIGGRELVLGIDRDITERKNTEERIKESEEKFRMVFENVFDGIVIYEEYPDFSQRKLIDFNKQYAAMAGLTREELLKYENTNSIQISLEESSNDVRLESLYTKKAFRGSFTWIRPDGKDNIIEFIGVPVMWRGKSYTIGIDRDITESKKAEAELIAAKEKAEENGQELKFRNEELLAKNRFIQTILDNLPIGISLNKIDEGDATFMNKKFQEIYGWTSDEISSVATFFEKVYPDVDYRNELIDRIMNDIQSGNPEKMHWEDIVITQKNGAQRIVNAVNIPLNEQNTMISTVVDITERKQAELALKESEDRYRSFISQVSEGVYRFECDQPMDINLPIEEQIDFIYDHLFIAEFNDAGLKMYGISDEAEMIGKGHLDFHGGRHNPINRDALRRFVSNEYHIENAVTEELNSLGQLIYISNNSLGIIENNQLVRMWGTQTDITEKVKADQVQQVLYAISNAALTSADLTELTELISVQLGKLFDSTNFYIAFYDETSGMLSTNYNQDERDEIDYWPAEKSATGYVIKHQKSLLATDVDVMKLCDAGEIEMIGTPSKVWLGVPLFLDQKVIGAIVVQNYDNPDTYTEKDKLMLEFISHQIGMSIGRKKADMELKEALEKAQESDRLKSSFLANMSHEIRTPLNSIIGFSDLLLDPDFDLDQHAEFAKMINASGNGLLTIISDIMDLSKIEAGQVEVMKDVLSVQKLIDNLQKEYSFRAVEKGLELRLDPLNPGEEIFIESDESKLRQILINFVGNAIKFTETGFIEIGIRAAGDSVQIQVKDSGIGIPQEYHDKIFERFRQVESSSTRKYGGNGLGLAISKSLVELLGGEIGMESEEGKGSTFYFTIPVS